MRDREELEASEPERISRLTRREALDAVVAIGLELGTPGSVTWAPACGGEGEARRIASSPGERTGCDPRMSRSDLLPTSTLLKSSLSLKSFLEAVGEVRRLPALPEESKLFRKAAGAAIGEAVGETCRAPAETSGPQDDAVAAGAYGSPPLLRGELLPAKPVQKREPP